MNTDQTTLPKPFVFVLMPFEPTFNDIYKFGIKGAVDEVGAYAERVDEQNFTEGILDRIFNQISKADVIVADMTGRNPNVFYEVGYAHALGKITLLLTQNTDDIPFDLKHRPHTVYEGKIETLRKELEPKLRWAIAEAKRRQQGATLEHFSVRLHGKSATPGIKPENMATISGVVQQKTFRIPINLRNDSFETLLGITHVYLFAAKNAIVVPYENKLDYSQEGLFGMTFQAGTTSTQTRKPVPLEPFLANTVDAPDGLTEQYRLPITFPPVPPGAMEEKIYL